MTGEYFLVPMLLVIGISYLIVRGAAVALMLTGLDERRARFQALSAFTGTGFTTQEAEFVVNHPQRRRIVTWLMILGNAGLVTVIVTATSSLVTSSGYHLAITGFALIFGVVLIFRLLAHNALIKRWERYIYNHLMKRGSMEKPATEDLLYLREGYGLAQVTITPFSPFAGRSLYDTERKDGQWRILSIERDSDWIPFPSDNEQIQTGDTITIYGLLQAINQVFRT